MANMRIERTDKLALEPQITGFRRRAQIFDCTTSFPAKPKFQTHPAPIDRGYLNPE